MANLFRCDGGSNKVVFPQIDLHGDRVAQVNTGNGYAYSSSASWMLPTGVKKIKIKKISGNKTHFRIARKQNSDALSEGKVTIKDLSSNQTNVEVDIVEVKDGNYTLPIYLDVYYRESTQSASKRPHYALTDVSLFF